MFGLEEWQLWATAGALVVGGIVKGVTAIGLPIVTIAITLNFLEPRLAIALVVVPILVTNLWQAVRAGSPAEPMRRFWVMILFFLAFLWLGSLLLARLDTGVLFGILGTVVTGFAVLNLWRPRPHALAPGTERWAGPLAGTLGGLLGGISTIWGPPMMMYFVLLKLSKEEWVRAVGLVWFIGAVPLTLFYWQNGVLTPERFQLSAAACVPGMLGILIGERLRRHIPEEMFRKGMLAALCIIGLNLIRRALT